MPEAPEPDVAPRRPWHRNPFVIAFVLGALMITALPFVQRRFLRAPPPIASLAAWSLPSLKGGEPVSSSGLAGRVVLLRLAPAPCERACVERQRVFGRALEHTSDLGERIQLVTAAMPGASLPIGDLDAATNARWHVGEVTADQAEALVGGLRGAWSSFAHSDAGATPEAFAQLPAIVVLDGRGRVRGFWRDDPEGLGNAINAARLLAKNPEF